MSLRRTIAFTTVLCMVFAPGVYLAISVWLQGAP